MINKIAKLLLKRIVQKSNEKSLKLEDLVSIMSEYDPSNANALASFVVLNLN
jgi:hypothetical protein